MAASTLRFAIIVALVVGGIVVINQAFPDLASSGDGGQGAIPDGGGPVVTTSPTGPTGETGPTGTTGQPLPSPTIAGTRVQVFNGTGVSGLAGDVTTQLIDRYNYQAIEPDDAPSDVAVTTIYYRAKKDQIEAEFLANDFFKRLDGVRIAKLEAGSEVDRTVQVAVFLGADYASSV